MLRKKIKFLFTSLIILIAYIVKCSTQTGDIGDEIDSYEQSNQKEAENDQSNEVDDQNENAADEVIPDTYEQLENFKEKKTATWKFKTEKATKLEAGFVFTTEEMQKFNIWKDGVIPYYIDVVSFSDKVLRSTIRNFLTMVNTATYIHFTELSTPPLNDDERWVFFVNRRSLLGCADHTVKNFTNKGVQQVVLGYDCMVTKGELAEAVMSIVGVPAQHNAPNRDDYIKINIENILPDKRYLFEKLNNDEWLFHDLAYDLNSVTHYDINKYSANGHVTIERKEDFKNLESAKSLSPTDILKVKMLYNRMTKHNKLEITECQKLFEKRNKFVRFISKKKLLKPRDKPKEYTNLAGNIEESNNKIAEQNEVSKEIDTTVLDKKKDEEVKQKTDGDEGQAEIKVGEGGKDYQNEENNKEKQETREKAAVEEKRIPFKHVPVKKKVISKSNALALLSDYTSDHQRVKLNLDISHKQKNDPLAMLSDYQTGDEHDRQKKLQLIQSKTLLNLKPKNLKFTNNYGK